MKAKSTTCLSRIGGLVVILLLGFLETGFAQSMQLSKTADFSSHDGIYSFSDVLYAKVSAPQVDYLDLKENSFRLKPVMGDDDHDIEGILTNNFDGTYQAQIGLANLRRRYTSWEFRVEIRDDHDGRFESRIQIIIQDSPGSGDSVQVYGRVDSLGSNFFRISGTTIFVDSTTQISESGQTLLFSDLQNSWKVNVFAEKRDDDQFWAKTIDVLRRNVSNQEVQTRGIIASLDSVSMIVNNIRFIFAGTTQFRDHEKRDIPVSSFAVGMLVEAEGRLDAAGNVIAQHIDLEDSSIGDDEIELVSKISAVVIDSTENSITISGTRFVVDANTLLLGYRSETIQLGDLRVGELVQVKARTRAGQAPLAERIQREDNHGDELEIKGTILSIEDSSLTVGQYTIAVTSQTIIFDDDHRFLQLSDLRTGLLVEVYANMVGSRYIAARIELEDHHNDEIEYKGFIENIADNRVTISGQVFVVDSATVIINDDNDAIRFGDLQVGMRVEVRADAKVDGSLYATRIKIEDFLQDEIELKGVITAIGNDNLTVAGIVFQANGLTAITDASNQSIDFSALTVGMIVEIRADMQNGQWHASRIHIEDHIDAIVEIRGKIESIIKNGAGPLSDVFTVLAQRIIVTGSTVILDSQNQAIPFASLNVDDFVEVRAQLSADSMLFALRVKKEDNSSDEIELTGGLTALSTEAITVGSETFAIDGTTVFLNHDQQPITVQDLQLGMVVEVKGQRFSDGSLFAVRVQIEDRHTITGHITSISGNSVILQNIEHKLTESTVISDAQNRQIPVQSLKVNQLVQVVAQTNQSQAEVLTLRVVFENATTAVNGENFVTPNVFDLSQNYPNPFNPTTVIRFALREAGAARLAVYDLLGRRIRMLTEGVRSAGEYEVVWDGRDDFGQQVASGVYFYRLEMHGFSQTRKLTLTR